MEADVDVYPQARKRARRTAPNPREDDRVYMNTGNLAFGTINQAEIHPEDTRTRLALLSERMEAVRDVAGATAAALGDTLAAATALATDLNARVAMPVPTVQDPDPDPDPEMDAEPTAEDSSMPVDSEVRKSEREGRKQERKIKQLVSREARGLQRL